jgi:hypothetical protein
MTEAQQLDEARRLLAWVYHRSRQGCFSFRRSVRDAALSDVNYWTEKYSQYWKPGSFSYSRERIWCGEYP